VRDETEYIVSVPINYHEESIISLTRRIMCITNYDGNCLNLWYRLHILPHHTTLTKIGLHKDCIVDLKDVFHISIKTEHNADFSIEFLSNRISLATMKQAFVKYLNLPIENQVILSKDRRMLH